MEIKITIQELMDRNCWKPFCKRWGWPEEWVSKGWCGRSEVIDLTEKECDHIGLKLIGITKVERPPLVLDD